MSFYTHHSNNFLMGSPLKILALTGVYWMFVNQWGPQFMENRPAYVLKKSMLVYNFLQVVANVYIFITTTKHFLTLDEMNWPCNIVHCKPVSLMCYSYYLLKVSDYSDTVFMVLRKRSKQISFLHVYHHIMMVLSVYLTARFNGCACLFMVGFVNVGVHAVMYLYYFVTILRPQLQASLWWKKHITQLQLAQFLFLFVYFAHKLITSDSDKPLAVMVLLSAQNMFMAFMFLDFYIKAYVRKPKPKHEAKE